MLESKQVGGDTAMVIDSTFKDAGHAGLAVGDFNVVCTIVANSTFAGNRYATGHDLGASYQGGNWGVYNSDISGSTEVDHYIRKRQNSAWLFHKVNSTGTVKILEVDSPGGQIAEAFMVTFDQYTACNKTVFFTGGGGVTAISSFEGTDGDTMTLSNDQSVAFVLSIDSDIPESDVTLAGAGSRFLAWEESPQSSGSPCASACSGTPLTSLCPVGWACDASTSTCNSNCTTEEDCDDGNSRTDDSCDQKNTCQHSQQQPDCAADADCVDDGFACTGETCENGTCESESYCDDTGMCSARTCTEGICLPCGGECCTDTDCDDQNEDTIDACVFATAGSTCSNQTYGWLHSIPDCPPPSSGSGQCLPDGSGCLSDTDCPVGTTCVAGLAGECTGGGGICQ